VCGFGKHAMSPNCLPLKRRPHTTPLSDAERQTRRERPYEDDDDDRCGEAPITAAYCD
jgi:hypothetical protein